MANVKLNPILERIRGQVGDLVFKRYEDRTILSRKPEPSGQPATPAQAAHRERFRQATVYGRLALADPTTRTFYEGVAEDHHIPVFAQIIADFFRAPTIHEIDLSAYTGKVGDTIAVTATDNAEVARVEVTVSAADGTLVETGEAVLDGGHWVYVATAAVAANTDVRIGVRAYDRPGGVGEAKADTTTPKK